MENAGGIPLTIEGCLERYVKGSNHANQERHNILWHAWCQNKRWIMQLLEGTMLSFSTYADMMRHMRRLFYDTAYCIYS